MGGGLTCCAESRPEGNVKLQSHYAELIAESKIFEAEIKRIKQDKLVKEQENQGHHAPSNSTAGDDVG